MDKLNHGDLKFLYSRRTDKKYYRAKPVLSGAEGQPAKQIQNPNIEIRNKLRDR
jgi:hypothetical protein